MRLDAIIKIGGSLGRGSGLPALCCEISRLGAQSRFLVVPGGGSFADQARDAYRRFALSETAAHRMALLAMDQYGYVLNHLITRSRLKSELQHNARAEAGHVDVLLPSSIVIQEDALPHSWHVTSDSIAAWIAGSIGCPRLVLLKDVDGLFCNGELIPEMTVDQLREHSGGVDGYLSKILSSVRVETWVINGLHPGRLGELMSTGRTLGTRVSAAKIA